MAIEAIFDGYGFGIGGSFESGSTFTDVAAFGTAPPVDTPMFMEIVAVGSSAPSVPTIDGWTQVATATMQTTAGNWTSGGPPDYHRRTLFWRRSDGTSDMETITGTTGTSGSNVWDRQGFTLSGDIPATGDIIVDVDSDGQGDAGTGLTWSVTTDPTTRDCAVLWGYFASINPCIVTDSGLSAVGDGDPLELEAGTITRTVTYSGPMSGWLVAVRVRRGGGIFVGRSGGVIGSGGGLVTF